MQIAACITGATLDRGIDGGAGVRSINPRRLVLETLSYSRLRRATTLVRDHSDAVDYKNLPKIYLPTRLVVSMPRHTRKTSHMTHSLGNTPFPWRKSRLRAFMRVIDLFVWRFIGS